MWENIEVLRRPDKKWPLSKDKTPEKIDALTNIANDGYPGLICNLTDFLKDNNIVIREATCRTVLHLFLKLDNKNEYYNTLKNCNISVSDIDFYETNFKTEQFIELLAIPSLNGNGYVREKAVIKLSEADSPRAIKFLIYRLADWVLPVRQAALKGIENFKSLKFIDNLIENMPLFEWLQKVERTDLSRIYFDLITFIASTNRAHVIANFKKYPDKIRFLLAKHISTSITDISNELKLFLNDNHFLIRSLVIDHFNRLTPIEIDQLLNDKSAKIRLQMLYCLKAQSGFEQTALKYLADNSGTIRQFARFTLKDSNINFAEFYNQNLQERNQIVGSICGLAEIEAKQYSETIKSYLSDKFVKVRKSAFLALRKLDEDSAFEFGFLNLDSPETGLRNVIIDYLAIMPRQEVLTKAQEIYKSGNIELKMSMLKLFGKIGGWTAIADLMIGTIDENENIRQVANGYLRIWKERAIRFYSTPKPGELDRANQTFAIVYKTHNDKKYFKTNPVDGLDFFLK